jgi:tetratricopeptide (TPR) repeat protein
MPATAEKSPLVVEAERWWRGGNLAKAGACFEAAVKKAPGDLSAVVGLARTEFVRGEKKKALDLLAQAERLGPKRPEVLVTRGVFAEADRKGKQALELYREATKVDPNSAEAHFNLGRALGKARKLDEAEKVLKRAIELDPENAIYHFHLAGVVGQKPKRLAEAVRLLGRALALNGRFVDAYCLLGDVLVRLRQIENAERILTSGARCCPESRAILERLAAVYQRKGDLVKARDTLREVAALPTAARDAEIWRRLALFELAARDGKQAIACGMTAAKLAPKSAEVQFALGVIYEACGKMDSAKAAYRKAIELDPNHWGALTNLGRMLLAEKKSLDEAVKLQEKAVSLAPKEPVPAFNLACVYAAKGDKAKAAAAAKVVLGMRAASKAMKAEVQKLTGGK